ncbi:uncharacterized protein LOC122395332 [Colletes gigas]|uniref:uncharacterized protein LOC122395332 n=1 Tax=Colletes gigas TaxID=935657 RepID=UPI001C9AD804|nr:uncharacterized protein LOC122395332 [Colletes gigas]XP_043248730.1 uncharacterized protein LOC122395332 [Colletes gigas]
MKAIVTVILLVSMVEGHVIWGENDREPTGPFYPGQMNVPPREPSLKPKHGFRMIGRPLPPFPFHGLERRHPHHWFPQQQPQIPAIDISNAEWVCRDPKSENMMIITTVAGVQTAYDQQQHLNEWWQNQNGNTNAPPSTTSTATPEPDCETEEPSSHGGEGLIDVRIASN